MEKFPYELEIAIKGLNNKTRQTILINLNKVEKLSFSELTEVIDADKPLLANHLKNLTRNLLVEHYFEHETGKEHFSFYRISQFGKTLLSNLMRTLIPPQIEFSHQFCDGFRTEGTNTISIFKIDKKNEMVDAASGDVVQKVVKVPDLVGI